MIECCQQRRWPDLATIRNTRIAKTWRTPLQKATQTDPEFQWLHDIADAMLPAVRAAFLRAVARIRGTIQEAQLRAALETGNVDAVMSALGLDQAMAAEFGPGLVKPLEDAFIDAGRAAPAETMPTAGQLGFRFDITNPNAIRFLQSYDMGLIREISDETRAAVRQTVEAAFQMGGHPREQARTIRDLVGLTRRQAQAVTNYRSALVEEERAPDQIERMTAKYEAKMLRLRGENIARTETLRAANAGQDAAWQQAADKGLLNRATLRRQWLVTPDDRLCVFCAAVPALNPEGVPLGGLFITPLGPVAYPPLHPQCRCIVVVDRF